MNIFLSCLMVSAWLACVLFCVPTLLAGFGLRKLARGLFGGIFFAIAGGIVIGVTAYLVLLYINSPVPWSISNLVERGLKAGSVSVPILFILSLARRIWTKRITLERSPKSWPLLGGGGAMGLVLTASTVYSVVWNNPSICPTAMLVSRAAMTPLISELPIPAVHQELIRRGPQTIPVLAVC